MALSDYIKFAWLDSNKGVRSAIGLFWILCFIVMTKSLKLLKQPVWVLEVGILILVVCCYPMVFFTNCYFAKKSFNAQQLKTINQVGYVCWLIFTVLAFLVTVFFDNDNTYVVFTFLL